MRDDPTGAEGLGKRLGRGTHTLHWWLADAEGHDLRLDRREVSDACWVTVQEIATLKPTFLGDRHFFEEVFQRA